MVLRKFSKKVKPNVTKRKQVKNELKKVTVVEDESFYEEPVKRIVQPDNQMVLTDKELNTDITRVLTGDDPNVPKNITKYNFKDKCYKLDPPGLSDHMAVHLVLEGNLIHIESKEYQCQKEREISKQEGESQTVFNSGLENSDTQKKVEQSVLVLGIDENKNQVVGIDESKNQFNYTERSAQTFSIHLQSRGVCTEPPPVTQYSAGVSQWQIYDSYVCEHVITNMEENNGSADKKKISFEGQISIVLENEEKKGEEFHSNNMAAALKITERLVNKNSQDEIYQDFKYWEDASDQYRKGEGSLLPLWRFATERIKRKQVTSLCWNPKYSDLFAVGYGSYDFLRQGSGMICCFSIKNTSFPEYMFFTESGVMCLDFHPDHSSLLAAGCYDGNVMIYNISNGNIKPIYSSSVKTGKHSDPVWQIHWQKSDLGKELNFYSISSDGIVANWCMSKNELKMEPVIHLKIKKFNNDDTDETSLTGLAGGCCFDFNDKQKHLFIIGTEEGNIHKCSKAYSGQYLETYENHHMAVYAVKWNPFHEQIFLSCSADWTVKMWDHSFRCPLMTFDLGNSVGDINWSPYSSTVFSAVSSDGKVHVFDMMENKHEALCEQKVVKRARLTHCRFNLKDYMLIVGDDRGGVNALKLSPNLRKVVTSQNEDIPDLTYDVQRKKIESLLLMVGANS